MLGGVPSYGAEAVFGFPLWNESPIHFTVVDPELQNRQKICRPPVVVALPYGSKAVLASRSPFRPRNAKKASDCGVHARTISTGVLLMGQRNDLGQP